MIDTGCDLNLIKESHFDSRVRINRNKMYHLVGVGPRMIPTLGEITLIIKGIQSKFQSVPKDVPISQNGILGISFLEKHNATLTFAGIELKLGNSELSKNRNSIFH